MKLVAFLSSKELESKLEASKLREEQLIAEVEAVGLVSFFFSTLDTVTSERSLNYEQSSYTFEKYHFLSLHFFHQARRSAGSESFPIARCGSYGGSIKNIPQVRTRMRVRR